MLPFLNPIPYCSDEIESFKIDAVFMRSYKGKVVKIILENGFDLTVTPEHKLFASRCSLKQNAVYLEYFSNVTKDACAKLKTDHGDNLRIYVVKYRKQEKYKHPVTGSETAFDYTYLDECATKNAEPYLYDVSDEDGLKSALQKIADDIKSSGFANYKQAENVSASGNWMSWIANADSCFNYDSLTSRKKQGKFLQYFIEIAIKAQIWGIVTQFSTVHDLETFQPFGEYFAFWRLFGIKIHWS